MPQKESAIHFEEFLEERGEPLARFFLMLVSDPLDAEDLLLTFAVRSAERRPAFRSEAEVYRVAVSVIRKQRRNAKRSAYRPVRIDGGRSAAAKRLEHIRSAWWRVPLADRCAVSLLLGAHRTRGDVAKSLVVRPEQVWSRVESALLRFQKEVDGRTRRAIVPKDWKEGEVLARLLADESAAEGIEGLSGRIHGDLVSADRNFRLVHKSALKAAEWRRMKKRAIRAMPSAGAELLFDTLGTPLGPFQIAALDGVVVGTCFGERTAGDWIEALGPGIVSRAAPDEKALRKPKREMAEYFAGKRKKFTFPYRLIGVTSFRASVLDACARVPFGSIASYKQIADAISQPSATRAVGGALGRNPLPVVIPCHRVLSQKGHLTGFAPGLDLKERLLALEGRGDLFTAVG